MEASARTTNAREISLIILNSNDSLPPKFEDQLAELADKSEIIAIDCGASETTSEQITRGFGAAKYESIVVCDARENYDLSHLKRLLVLLEDFDCVRGFRQNNGKFRVSGMMASLQSMFINRLLATDNRDPLCGFFAVRKNVVADFTADCSGAFALAEVSSHVKHQGKTQTDVAVSGEQSVQSWRNMFGDWSQLIRRSYNRVWFPSQHVPKDDAFWSSHWATAGLLLVAVLLLFGDLSYPLVEPDETRYAEVSLEMWQRGDWVIPTIQGEPFLDKPPLLYWLTMVSYSLLGVSEFSARLPIALSALACVMSVFFIGRKLVGSRAAWMGSALLLMCAGFLLAGRFVITDCLLACCTTVCGLAAYTALRENRVQWSWWLLACFAAAAGVLTKGPLAIVLVAPPLVVACWLARNRAILNWKAIVAIVGIVATLALPWYVLIHFSQQEFASHFYLKQYVARYVNAFDHKEPWWFYAPVLLLGMAPTTLLFPALGVFLFSRKPGVRAQRTVEAGFLMMWVVWIIGFFSLASCKLPTYILPAIPPLCLLMGKMVNATLLRDVGKWLLKRTSNWLPRNAAISSCSFVVLVALTRLALSPATTPNYFDLAMIAAGFTGFVVVAFVAFPSDNRKWAVTGIVTLLALGYAFNATFPTAMAQRSYMCKAAGTLAQWNQTDAEKSPVAFYNNRGDGRQFYLAGAETHQYYSQNLADLYDLVARRQRVLVITSPSEVEEIKADLPTDFAIKSHGGRGFVWEVTSPSVRVAKRPARSASE